MVYGITVAKTAACILFTSVTSVHLSVIVHVFIAVVTSLLLL